MPIWRSLRPEPTQQGMTQDELRYAVDDLLLYLNTMSYGGNVYGLGGTNTVQTLAGDVEPALANFSEYATGAFGGNAIVFACLALRQLVFSSVRFQWQEITNGRPARLFGSSILKALEEPWPGGTTQDLTSRMIQDADLAGNFYGIRDTPLAVLGTQNPSSFEIVRLRPDWVDILFSPRMVRGAQVGRRIEGIAYWEGGRNSGRDPVIFFPGEYTHFAPYPDPLASWRGMSWITPVVREIQGDGQMMRHKLKYFENGATPNLIVKYPSGAREEEMRKVRDLFKMKYEGVDNAYKTLHIGGGADVSIVGHDMTAIDFKKIQSHGEVRIAAAAGLPPVILGFSEALTGSSLNQGNYASARRRMSDGTMHPLWQQAAGSLQTLFTGSDGLNKKAVFGGPSMADRISSGMLRLWYDVRDIPFLREDAKEEAEIRHVRANTVRQYIDSGFVPESAVEAVDTGDMTVLKHTGLVSVQLLPPGIAYEPSAGGAQSEGAAANAAAAKAAAAKTGGPPKGIGSSAPNTPNVPKKAAPPKVGAKSAEDDGEEAPGVGTAGIDDEGGQES